MYWRKKKGEKFGVSYPLNRTAAAERWRNAHEFSIEENRDIQFRYYTSYAQTFHNVLGFAQQNISLLATVAEFLFEGINDKHFR